MITTTVAGRTWNFSHAMGRASAAGAGFNFPTAVTTAPGGAVYVLNRGSEGLGEIVPQNKRIGKLTLEEEYIGEFGRGEITWPMGLAVDSDGNVYCSDEHEKVILVFDQDGQRLGQWGEAGTGEGQLNGPSGIAFDAEDNLYVVDSRNDRVQRFTREGKYLSGWGSSGTGDGQFSQPWGITVDPEGDVYVVDWGNDRCQKFSPDGTFLTSFGSSDAEGGDLDHPADVAVDSDGDVYVTDWGNKRVQVYDSEGQIITTLWGDAYEFSTWAKEVVDANPDVVKAYRRVEDKTPMARFDRPVGIAVDDRDRIVVVDVNRHRIQVYQKEREYLDPQFNL